MAQLLCELNLVAVGGGGMGIRGGGGGSGYVSSMNVPVPFPQLIVRAGKPGRESTIRATDQLLLEASEGEHGSSNDEGYSDGYSGGGYRDDGGENGGDGHGDGEFVGRGSGLDLTSIILQQFSLSPGAGGKGDGYGGGGGGVLVNGVGPHRIGTGSGEGYGGGRYHGRDSEGPGIVLVEINRRK